MTARVNNIFHVLETLKADIEAVSLSEGVSKDLLWILIRQQSDYELLLLAEQAKSYSALAAATL
tara:strand:- start:36 stop:227 length:192 start_codon:yes stop_codon:yes gene_type:complete